MVELELPHSVALKEQQEERPGETSLSAPLIEPELAVDDLVSAAEPLDGLGLSEEDVVAPAIGSSTRSV